MNVLLLTIGSRGDVTPFVALALRLQQRGHHVMLAAPAQFAEWVARQGVRFAPLDKRFLDLTEGDAARQALDGATPWARGRAVLALYRQVGPAFAAMLDDMAQAAVHAAPEVIVYHPKALGGASLAERYGARAVVAMPTWGLAPTGQAPALGMPALPLGAAYNRATYRLLLAGGSASLSGVVNTWRRGLGLPRLSTWADPFANLDDTPRPILVAVSPVLVDVPPDWPPTTVATGAWVLPDDSATPADDLARFIEDGPPPVVVGFGSMTRRAPPLSCARHYARPVCAACCSPVGAA